MGGCDEGVTSSAGDDGSTYAAATVYSTATGIDEQSGRVGEEGEWECGDGGKVLLTSRDGSRNEEEDEGDGGGSGLWEAWSS